MRSRWPRTLFGQIALALFGGLFAAQILGLWFMLDERSRINYKLLAEYSAQRMGGIVSVLEQADPEDRPKLVKDLSVPPTTIALDIPWSNSPKDLSAPARLFVSQATQEINHPVEIQVLSMENIDQHKFESLFHRFENHPGPPVELRNQSFFKAHIYPRTYIAQARLNDGTIVSFHHVLPEFGGDYPLRIIVVLLMLGLSVGLLSLWAVRRLTRPLASLAHAAGNLAQNLNCPALPEAGPQEVRQAAHAFNAMQRALKRHIDTRAQALSAVSHDLRLPLTRLRLRLEDINNPALQSKMERDIDEMDSMIGHTLDYLRAGSSTEVPVALNLDTLLDSVVEDIEELGATVSRSGKTDSPFTARPHALRRCIANLLDNARLYGGGDIQLSVEDHQSFINVQIQDKGPGIPEEDLERVLEPYFRLESSRARHTGGTGLGLAIAQAIVELHGGTITLSSRPGQGLLVSLRFPRSTAAR